MKIQTLMKYCIIIAFVLALLAAYPISEASATQTVHAQSVAHHSAIKPVAISKPTQHPQQSKTVQVPPQPPKPQPVAAPAVSQAPAVPTVQAVGCARFASYFEQYDWNVKTAIAICQAESGGNASAVSNANINFDSISDYGLMQLHGVDILDPAANISYAYYHKYLTQGWAAWSTYTSGRYTQFL